MKFNKTIFLLILFSLLTECKSSQSVQEIKAKTDFDLEGQYFVIGKGGYGDFELVESFPKFEKSKNLQELTSFSINEEGKIFGLHTLMKGRENSFSSLCYITNVKTINIGFEIKLNIDCKFNRKDDWVPYSLNIRKGPKSMKSSYHNKFQNIDDIILIEGVGGWPPYLTKNPNQLFKDQNVHREQSNFDLSAYPIGSVFKVSEEENLRTLLNAYLTDSRLTSKVMNDLEISGNEFEINDKSKKYEAIRKNEIIYIENFGLSLGKYDFKKQGYNLSINFDHSVGGYFGRAPFEYAGIYSETIFFPIAEADAKNFNLSDYTYSGLFKPKLSIEKEKYVHCNSKGLTIITSQEFMDMASNVDPTIVCKVKEGSFAKVKLNLVKFRLLNKNNNVILEKNK
ncbi:hypothetical protein HGB47_16520 [Leptospira yasudae]|uniref:hypothetical protein n=1 Tax=Leptospira yasudae TaxID=2202201 RepID=UPI001C4EC807|nr:hypothetical protein [Leptospira yasudae]MBW0435218.1 hypothetical protein [Leptospira yasudae]